MPRVKRKPSVASSVKMPKGFYLKMGTWYKRILKPDPKTGVYQVGIKAEIQDDRRALNFDLRTKFDDPVARYPQIVRCIAGVARHAGIHALPPECHPGAGHGNDGLARDKK